MNATALLFFFYISASKHYTCTSVKHKLTKEIQDWQDLHHQWNLQKPAQKINYIITGASQNTDHKLGKLILLFLCKLST